jgi:fucose 4-O-acetylase-like acetyltransferase
MAHIIALLPTLPAGLVRKAIVLATLSLNLVARSGVSLAGCLCVYSLSRYVPEPVLRPFEYVGAQTLGIYAVNGIVLLGLVTLGLTQPQLLFAATLALSLGATLLIRRIPVASDYLLGTLRRPPRSST